MGRAAHRRAARDRCEGRDATILERRQSAVRGLCRRFRFRLARRWARAIERASALSESHQCVVHPRGGPAHARRPVLRARRGRNHEFGYRIDWRGGGRGRARTGRESGASADARRSAWRCAGRTATIFLAGPAEIVASGEFYYWKDETESAVSHVARACGRRSSRTQARVGVVGLGYVGLPLAVEFAQAGFYGHRHRHRRRRRSTRSIAASPIFRTSRPRC